MPSEKITSSDGPSGYKASLDSLYQFLSDVGQVWILLASMMEHDGYLKSMLDTIAPGRVIRGVTLQLDYNNITVTTSELFHFSSFN